MLLLPKGQSPLKLLYFTQYPLPTKASPASSSSSSPPPPEGNYYAKPSCASLGQEIVLGDDCKTNLRGKTVPQFYKRIFREVRIKQRSSNDLLNRLLFWCRETRVCRLSVCAVVVYKVKVSY
jgi:hypothetical protein